MTRIVRNFSKEEVPNQPYLVREPPSVIINFGIVPETIKDSFIGKHINITPFVNLLRCEGLSCLKEKLNDTLDLSTDRAFPDAVDKLKTLGVVGEFDRRSRLEARGSRDRGGPGRTRRCSGSIDAGECRLASFLLFLESV